MCRLGKGFARRHGKRHFCRQFWLKQLVQNESRVTKTIKQKPLQAFFLQTLQGTFIRTCFRKRDVCRFMILLVNSGKKRFYESNLMFFFEQQRPGIIKLPGFGRIKPSKCMVILSDFPLIVHCLGWFHIMTPEDLQLWRQNNFRKQHHPGAPTSSQMSRITFGLV